nr:phosphoadenosine phosphosulfate reductase family protein [uncultured Cellulosilyticum sp.]
MLNEFTKANNIKIYESAVITKSKLDNPNYERIMVSISGGADSDIMLDLFAKLDDKEEKVHYVFFDTGLEYKATKEHLKELEDKYNIKIEVEKPKVPIPVACNKYGQPFLSKQVSEYIQRLQKHSFKWEDRPFEELYKEYPNCKIALLWWCNGRGEGSSFNIERNKYLKEFMLDNPPNFKISNICCKCTKKDVKHRYIKENQIQLSVVGVRKAEGGARSKSYKNCFTTYEDKADEYRPLFWYINETIEAYKRTYNVTNSDCYTKYGLKRTGCAGCPYGKDFEFELKVLEKYEPKLYKAASYIFKDSYEYTRKYREFVKKMESDKK